MVLDDRPTAVFDTECYPNLWCIGFRDVKTGQVVVVKRTNSIKLDTKRLARIFRKYRVAGFNSANYDMPMIALAMTGATCSELKAANDAIIYNNLKHWQFRDKFGVEMPGFVDHIDLMDMAPSAAQRFGLKKYAGVMHSRRMQELPYEPDMWLDDTEIWDVEDYLGNDLEVTYDLYCEMQPQLQLRAVLSKKYNFDFRSKSDAQCGEAVVKLLVEKQTGERLYKPDIRPGTFKFEAPAYVSFQTEYMRDVLQTLLRSDFRVKPDGYVEMPASLANLDIKIGGGVYRMGIGGLHSSESSVSHYSDETHTLKDRDVTSYYPNLMIRSGREPANMRGMFKPIFVDLTKQRVAAKKAGDKSTAESLKIFINGLFGKTGSPFSIVYSPQMLIQTTVSGQLSLLMLIEALELNDFQVVSANTDGIITLVDNERTWLFEAIIFDWECVTGLMTEETEYLSVHSRDVNNYLAFYKDRDDNIGVKRKGTFAPSGRGIPGGFGLKKTPDMEICVDAVINYLRSGVPIEETVIECGDIRKFVIVRKVTGGAVKDDVFIGKNVRYYLCNDKPGPLRYANNGNKVPSSDWAHECMELPEELPTNINYDLYVNEAYALLADLGLSDVPDPTTFGREGLILGHREEQKTVHTIDASTAVALCGAVRKSRRDHWIEVDSIPEGMRDCAKCSKVKK